jgi:hypothetical protein
MQTEDIPETPVKHVGGAPKTPTAPRYSSAMSPPDTKRTTRAADKIVDDQTPVKPFGRRSPFDSWPRVKDRSGTSSKRTGDSLASAPAKRPKAA